MTTRELMDHPCSCKPMKYQFRSLDLHCDRHGVYPGGKYCPTCDTDMHRCGGCGEYLTHWESMCDDCQAELAASAGVIVNSWTTEGQRKPLDFSLEERDPLKDLDHTDPESPHPEVP